MATKPNSKATPIAIKATSIKATSIKDAIEQYMLRRYKENLKISFSSEAVFNGLNGSIANGKVINDRVQVRNAIAGLRQDGKVIILEKADPSNGTPAMYSLVEIMDAETKPRNDQPRNDQPEQNTNRPAGIPTNESEFIEMTSATTAIPTASENARENGRKPRAGTPEHTVASLVKLVERMERAAETIVLRNDALINEVRKLPASIKSSVHAALGNDLEKVIATFDEINARSLKVTSSATSTTVEFHKNVHGMVEAVAQEITAIKERIDTLPSLGEFEKTLSAAIDIINHSNPQSNSNPETWSHGPMNDREAFKSGIKFALDELTPKHLNS